MAKSKASDQARSANDLDQQPPSSTDLEERAPAPETDTMQPPPGRTWTQDEVSELVKQVILHLEPVRVTLKSVLARHRQRGSTSPWLADLQQSELVIVDLQEYLRPFAPADLDNLDENPS